MPNLNNFNESDVREDIIAPLLSLLGYKKNSDNDIIRELTLKYPKAFLGRKKKSDPSIKGVADYVLEVEKRYRWVIEAKSPSETLSLNVVEQAYTYANHPEVRGLYYALCNGKELVVYQTNLGPNNSPVLRIENLDIDKNINEIETILSPSSILRDFPEIKLSSGEPLAKGLRSFANVKSGTFKYTKSELPTPILRELEHEFLNGVLQRGENGFIEASFELSQPIQKLKFLTELFGNPLSNFKSRSKFLSSDPTSQTKFRSHQIIILKKGTSVPDLNTWKDVILQVDVKMHIVLTAYGHLTTNSFEGNLENRIRVKGYPKPIISNAVFKMQLE